MTSVSVCFANRSEVSERESSRNTPLQSTRAGQTKVSLPCEALADLNVLPLALLCLAKVSFKAVICKAMELHSVNVPCCSASLT